MTALSRKRERDDNNNKCTSICGHILIITIAKYVTGRPSVIVESSEISLELFMYEIYKNIRDAWEKCRCQVCTYQKSQSRNSRQHKGMRRM
jgi:hypothetical protein